MCFCILSACGVNVCAYVRECVRVCVCGERMGCVCVCGAGGGGGGGQRQGHREREREREVSIRFPAHAHFSVHTSIQI